MGVRRPSRTCYTITRPLAAAGTLADDPAVGGADGELHLGVTPWLGDGDGAADSVASQAERAEALGFASFWLPESHFIGRDASPAPLLRLAAVAARTQRLRIATTSFLLPVRHPIHVAEEVAVLDRLSNGRVILGVGRGFRSALFAAFDVPASEKRDRFEAALRAVLDAWRGEPVAWESDGDAGSTPVHLAPRPLQEPHPPIWVAAFGPKAVAQAGRLGLPYLASPIEPMARLAQNYARHRAALPPQRPPGSLAVPVIRTVFASRSASQVARAREALARQAAAAARASRSRIHPTAPEDIDAWALVGEPERVREGIARYRETLGMTHLIARAHLPGLEPAARAASVECLAGLAP
jgi:alkanesulfonate monooxygenase SsuD/methylene tetrahydromethanopterin reductase-like flavin-dependent oxidoreductase (luciferase family)